MSATIGSTPGSVPRGNRRDSTRRAMRSPLDRCRPRRRRLAVRQSLTTKDYAVILGEPKTSRGRRSLDLDPETVATMRAWKAAQNRERLLLGPGWENRLGLVFTLENGAPIHPNTVGKIFDTPVKSAGCTEDPLARRQAHARDAAPRCRSQRKSRVGTPRAQLRRVHARHVRARDAGPTSRRRGRRRAPRRRREMTLSQSR